MRRGSYADYRDRGYRPRTAIVGAFWWRTGWFTALHIRNLRKDQPS